MLACTHTRGVFLSFLPDSVSVTVCPLSLICGLSFSPFPALCLSLSHRSHTSTSFSRRPPFSLTHARMHELSLHLSHPKSVSVSRTSTSFSRRPQFLTTISLICYKKTLTPAEQVCVCARACVCERVCVGLSVSLSVSASLSTYITGENEQSAKRCWNGVPQNAPIVLCRRLCESLSPSLGSLRLSLSLSVSLS